MTEFRLTTFQSLWMYQYTALDFYRQLACLLARLERTFLHILGLRDALADLVRIALTSLCAEGLVQTRAEVAVPQGVLATEEQELFGKMSVGVMRVEKVMATMDCGEGLVELPLYMLMTCRLSSGLGDDIVRRESDDASSVLLGFGLGCFGFR